MPRGDTPDPSTWRGQVHLAIRSVLEEVMPLMREAFELVDHSPEAGSALDQVYLIDGDEVVEDYLGEDEFGIALDHLLYMIGAPPLIISPATFEQLARAATLLRLPDSYLAAVQVSTSGDKQA